MQIRQMSIDDYDEVYSLWMSTPGIGLNNIDDSITGISKYLARNPNTCFVAIEDKDIIGVVCAGHDGRRGSLMHTCVHKGYRKKGIGTALVNKAISALAAEGIRKVYLVVFDKNESGQRFWEERGWNKRNDLIYYDIVL